MDVMSHAVLSWVNNILTAWQTCRTQSSSAPIPSLSVYGHSQSDSSGTSTAY